MEFSRLPVLLVSLLVALASYYYFCCFQLAKWNSNSYQYEVIQEGDAIVVTGAHTGIGKHAALTLAREGFLVFCGVRKLEHGAELLQAAASASPMIDPSKLRPILLDVTNPEQVAAAVELVTAEVGEEHGLYGLFNNAGMLNPIVENEGRSVEYLPMETFRQVFEVNYFGLLQVTKAFLPLLRRHRRGRILSNSSIAGFYATEFWGAYASSKFAVEALMDSLRRELLGMVHVSLLEPGMIKTPLIHKSLASLVGYQGYKVLGSNTLYAEQEVATMRRYAKMALDGASPQVTSNAVVHAMRSPRPKIRYLVGPVSGMARFLASLPAGIPDAIALAGRKSQHGIISDDELVQLLLMEENGVDVEFEL